jgi:low temperature requirement protein LtrA
VKSLVAPLRLRSTLGERAHKVTWLELFLDLIFVAAVAQVAEPLRHHYSFGELVRLAPLLALIWWAWTGYTLFATRFDVDDAGQRVLTFLQMFIVAAMAANATEALDSRSSAGFVAAYAAMRLILVAQYLRVRRIPAARALAMHYAIGHGIAAIMWLTSALFPPPARLWLWAVAIIVDLSTPWSAVHHNVKLPPNAAHLPERFGLFTLILLGDAVVAVMKGMESQEEWPIAAATSAVLSMGILFVLWWWYFGGAAAGAEQHIRSHRDSVRLHLWSYTHFPLYLGIIVAGVGLQRIVMSAARTALDSLDVLLLTSAVTTVMLAMMVIGTLPREQRRQRRVVWAPQVLIAGVTMTAGATGLLTSPVPLIVTLAGLSIAQLAFARSNSSVRSGEPHGERAAVH